jgi:uncharacterized repeat protein (TIGR01451 family)
MGRSCLLLALAAATVANSTPLAEPAPIPLPVICSFSPTSGYVGTPVTIDGTNFLQVQAVRFNGVDASFGQVPPWTGDLPLWAQVPAGASTGPITIVTPAGVATSKVDFVVLQHPIPKITGFSQSSGYPGTSLTIFGENLVDLTGVQFNEVEFPLGDTVWFPSGSQVLLTIPTDATTGPVTLQTKWGDALSPDSFTVLTRDLSPKLNSFSPLSGYSGSWIDVDGQNLDHIIISVDVNGVPAVFTQLAAPASLELRIPEGATTGPITIATQYGSVTSATPLTITAKPPPVITRLEPAEAPMGFEVYIMGEFLDGAQAVLFNGTPSTQFYSDATMIEAYVPIGAGDGPVTVTTARGTAASTNNFHVLPTGDLVLTQTASSRRMTLGHELTYGITVTNLGPSPLTSVVLTNKLVLGNKWLRPTLVSESPLSEPEPSDIPDVAEPNGFEIIQATTTRGTVNLVNGILVGELGSLQSGEKATVQLTVRVLKPGRLIHVTVVRTPDADLQVANNFALTWTDVVSPTELLVRQISANVCEISWSADATGFALQSRDEDSAMASRAWSDVPTSPELRDGWWTLLQPEAGTARCYRLLQRTSNPANKPAAWSHGADQ